VSPPPGLHLPLPVVPGGSPRSGGTGLTVAAIACCLEGDPAAGFLCRRAVREAERGVGRGAALALRVLDCLGTGDMGRLSAALLALIGQEELGGHLDEALQLLDQAVRLEPGCPRLAMHEGRLRRKKGDREGARLAYRRVVECAPRDSTLCRLAELGEAMLADEPVPLLGPLAGRARRAGDLETAGVALEERAQHLARGGAGARAVRDAVRSAACYPDDVDRVRVLMFAAEVLVGRGDLAGARELLLLLPPFRHHTHRSRVEQQLRLISRVTGDQVGLRRWRDASPAALVTLLPSPRTAAQGRGTLREGGIPRLVSALRRIWALAA